VVVVMASSLLFLGVGWTVGSMPAL
jgi:hypothetical protein